jgi:DNA mismatch repair protein MutL
VGNYALAYPELRVTLQNNERLVVRTQGSGALFDALVAIYGLDVAEQMIEIARPEEGSPERIRVWGYIGAPALHRADRRDITFFVNRRWVQDNALSYAVSEAYRTLLPAGRHPMVVLNIALPPEDVDVNIHPTKREVRFRHERDVFGAVQKVVRTTLMAQHPIPVVRVPFSTSAWQDRQLFGRPGSLTPSQVQMALEIHRTADVPQGSLGPAPVQPLERLPMLRVLGQIAQTYIIAEGPGGMYLIDQHAAHERLRYEELKAQRAQSEVAAQELLDPQPIELSPQQGVLLEAHLEALSPYGFEVIPFGGTTFLVKRVPANLVGQDIPAAIVEILNAALEGSQGFSWEEQIFITLSCHTAVRAGQTLTPDELRDLVRRLEKAALPHTCPHGRPTMIHLSQERLEREFGRR